MMLWWPNRPMVAHTAVIGCARLTVVAARMFVLPQRLLYRTTTITQTIHTFKDIISFYDIPMEDDFDWLSASTTFAPRHPLGTQTTNGVQAAPVKGPSAPTLTPPRCPQPTPKGPSLASAELFPTLPLEDALREKLHDYQQEGVEWLFRQHKVGCGCLLADEMGLGKTVQVATYLGVLMRHQLARTIILVMPGTLIEQWCTALRDWGRMPPGVVEVVHTDKKALRDQRWARLSHGVPVCILTTFGIMKRDQPTIEKFKVDYIVVDEAHNIKDASTDVAKAALGLRAHHKIAITGTPLMNSFQDLWSLFEFADPGLLGMDSSTFGTVNQVMLRANERDSLAQERECARRQLQQLQEKLWPRMLRRQKHDVGSAVLQSTKTDVVVWVTISDVQRAQYLEFLLSDVVQIAVRQLHTKQPLVLLNALRNIVNHPWLNFSDSNYRDAMSTPLHVPSALPEFGAITSSAKLDVALALVAQHVAEHRKTLVFSRSKRLLDIFAFLLRHSGLQPTRLDGDVPAAKRGLLVKEFAASTSSMVCLLTTQVGGVGITLHCASRVILLDPSWNPAVDAQAVDRAHRIGQTENVVVYRLIATGTVDESIYRNQIYKMMAAVQAQSQQGADTSNQLQRHFTRLQLRSMFQLGDTTRSETADQLCGTHPVPLASGLLEHLQTVPRVCGVSDHSAVVRTSSSQDEAETIDRAPTEKPTIRRRRGHVEAAAPSSTLTELANELADADAACDDDLAGPASFEWQLPSGGRCSILRQDTSLETIMRQELLRTHTFFRGVPIRRLLLEDVFAECRPSLCLTEALSQAEGFQSDGSDGTDGEDVSPGGGASTNGPDWAQFDVHRPSFAERRRAACSALLSWESAVEENCNSLDRVS